ncbi:MAG: DUF5667 domain-containing protein [Anaerolineales bacterium]|nr:DUF5667 domain-containing protein [Anaerolineales bacterium]
MNKIYDALEICLQELENGADVKTVLARYPESADELRPILEASIAARKRTSAQIPSPEAVRRGRAKLLQRAAEMREAIIAPRKRIIPLFQRLAISFTLTATFLLSGTGLVGASSSALPGQNLYPVKRGWEDARLFFVFDKTAREILENKYESERLNEVSELLAEGRDEDIQFTGVFTTGNNIMYVSGVTVLFPANLQTPANGAAVIVTGRTNAQGFVEVRAVEMLPIGAMVPAGQPLEVETQTDASNYYEMKGILQSSSSGKVVINGQTFYLNNSVNADGLILGAQVEIKGYYDADGKFIVTEIKMEGPDSE